MHENMSPVCTNYNTYGVKAEDFTLVCNTEKTLSFKFIITYLTKAGTILQVSLVCFGWQCREICCHDHFY